MPREDWSGGLRSRRGEGVFFCGGGDEERRVREQQGFPEEVGGGTWVLRLLLRVWALYLMLKFSCMSRFGSPKCPKSDGALRD